METILVFTIGLLYVGVESSGDENLVADLGHSVCLTRIVQLVDSVRLNYKDPTWSNVDVAIWNMIESHIGAVAANMLLMGPIVSLVSKRLRRHKTPVASHRKGIDTGSSSYALASYKRSEHGFKRMDDDILGVSTPTIESGVSTIDQSLSVTGQAGYSGIKVETDLEQDYGFRS